MKASFLLSGKVSEILPRIEHIGLSIFPASYSPNHLDEPRFTDDDLNFLILVKMLWTVDCRGNKTINLLSKNSTFSLECFLQDYKNRNKFNEWTKVAETLQSEIAQVTSVTFSGLQRKRNLSICKLQEKYIGIFSSFEASCGLYQMPFLCCIVFVLCPVVK